MVDVIKAFSKVLPHVTSKRIARLTGHTQRVVQRWISGELPMPMTALAVVGDQTTKLNYSEWPHQLGAVIAAGQQHGLHSEVMASYLAVEYKKLTGADLE